MIRKIINFIRNKYHICKLCKGDMYLIATNESKSFQSSYVFYPGIISDCNGLIYVKCVACKGTGIVWGKKGL